MSALHRQDILSESLQLSALHQDELPPNNSKPTSTPSQALWQKRRLCLHFLALREGSGVGAHMMAIYYAF